MIYSLWTCFSVPLFHVPNTFNFDFIETKVYFEWCDFLFLFFFFLLRFLHSHSINANKVKIKTVSGEKSVLGFLNLVITHTLKVFRHRFTHSSDQDKKRWVKYSVCSQKL